MTIIEWIDANWVYFAVAITGYVVGSLHGKNQIRQEWYMSEQINGQQGMYDDHINNLRNATSNENLFD